jgi:hypothetical protein
MRLGLFTNFFCLALALLGVSPAHASKSFECTWIADHPTMMRLDEIFQENPWIQGWNRTTPYTIFGIVQNSGEQLAKRLSSPYDDHVHALVQLGFVLQSSKGALSLEPGSQIIFIQNYNGGILKLIQSGQRKEDEVFWYALFIKDQRTGDTKYLRPGIDALPPPEFLEVMKIRQISHLEWEMLAARGLLVGDFTDFDHFTSHLTESFFYQEKSALLRKYYRSRVDSDRHEFELVSDTAKMQIADESLALPRLELEDVYRESLPFVFNRYDGGDLLGRKKTLKLDAMSDAGSFLKQAETLILKLEPTLRLSGGAVRDSFNRFKLLIPAKDREYSSPNFQTRGRSLELMIRDGLVVGTVVQSDHLLAHLEYLKIALNELKVRYPALFDHELPPEFSSPLFPVYGVIPQSYAKADALELIAGIRAHVESVLLQTLRLKMSPEQMLQDLIDDIPEGSITREFIQKCYDERSPTYSTLLEP